MSRRTITIATAVMAAIIVTAFAGGTVLARGGAKKPAAAEFGPGPRTSAQGLYIATLNGAENLRPRKLQQLQLSVVDAAGHAVTDAAITIDGGMPEHGHGFPTRPRVTRNLGSGWYQIGGLRFNMGGWWELKVTIATPAGTDTVTFNLSL